MMNMLSKAYAGQPEARQSLQNIEPLHAFYDHAEESYYAGDAEWHGNRIHIMLHAGDREEAESMLPGVEQLLDNLNTLDEQARQSFAAELLDIWNEHWLDEYLEEEPYTAAQFASHLKLRELEWEQDRQVCIIPMLLAFPLAYRCMLIMDFIPIRLDKHAR